MARPKTVMQGYRVGKWIVVAEAERTASGQRKVVCECLACGAVKEIAVTSISARRMPDCACKKEPPEHIPLNSGTSCLSRIATCDASAAGKCCYYCREREQCADNCLNTPDKCGSFNAIIKVPTANPNTVPFKGRTLLAPIGGRKK